MMATETDACMILKQAVCILLKCFLFTFISALNVTLMDRFLKRNPAR